MPAAVRHTYDKLLAVKEQLVHMKDAPEGVPLDGLHKLQVPAHRCLR